MRKAIESHGSICSCRRHRHQVGSVGIALGPRAAVAESAFGVPLQDNRVRLPAS